MPIDYSKYPPNWLSEIVPRILTRDGNKCTVCGLENGQVIYAVKLYLRLDENRRYGFRRIWFRDKSDAERIKSIIIYDYGIKEVRVQMQVAHLDRDEDNHAVKDDRLKTMCQYCHLAYDAEAYSKEW